jgi:hypothetical protein
MLQYTSAPVTQLLFARYKTPVAATAPTHTCLLAVLQPFDLPLPWRPLARATVRTCTC